MTTTTFTRDRALARGGPFAWRAVDLVTLAVLGVALGVAFWGFDTVLYGPLKLALAGFPPASALTLGVWLLPAVLGALIVRRPGAALFIELVAANLEMVLGNQWGSGVMISAVLQALGVEVVVAAYRWRRWRPDVALAAGALAAVFEVVGYEWWAYVAEYSWGWKLAHLGFSVASGLVLAGLGGWALMKALAATGVLAAFPPGVEHLAAESAHADDEDHEDDEDDADDGERDDEPAKQH